MTVLVTGATGFVGREIVAGLNAAGHQVRALARRRKPGRVHPLSAQDAAESYEGDVKAPESLPGAVEGVEAIIHLVGIISEVGESTFENVHTRGTGNVVVAAQRAGIKRFVHMSALGTRPGARSRYHQSKWAAEEIVRQSGLDYTIFRPSLIYGPHDHFVNLFARIIRLSPVVPVMGNGQVRLQPVAVKTVAMAFVQALTEPKAVGQTFDLCGPERLSFDEVLNQILGVMGRRRLKLHVPLALARCQALLLECLFQDLLRQAPPLNRDQLIMLQEDNVGEAGPANKLFGLEQAGFKEGIREYLAPEV